MSISRGTRVRRYEVTAPLGAGGMGEVFLARDVELDRTVALKVLRDDAAGDAERNRRFVQEARAAISLNHPNVAHVYDVGEEGGVRFMAMEYVEGETLRAKMARERLTLLESLDIAAQIASALASAHALGIVHRDIKPENVMIRPDGYVKVLDFGLAKLTPRGGGDDTPTLVVNTAPGTVMGTMQYMSPEQLRTDDVDPRSDIFSLGVVLYEMVTGARPFDASSPSGVIAAILTDEPRPLDPAMPPSVRAIVHKALQKKREDRFANARELAEALKLSRDETRRIRSGDVPTQMLTELVAVPRRVPWKWIAAALVLVALIATGAWFASRARVRAEARAKLPQLEKLAEERKFFAAWDLAAQLSSKLPNEPAIARVQEKIGTTIDVKTEPSGAQVFLERINDDGTTAPRQLAGTTPLSKYALPRGDYILRIEKGGFAPAARTISLSLIPVDQVWIPPSPPSLDFRLVAANDAPPRMVRVPGGRYRIAAWGRPTNDSVNLDDFFIDQFEVTNREFHEFVAAGGYERAELWKTGANPADFKDSTGLSGPRRWVNQSYPVGRDDYPVTDVSWHEAAAYAEFRGKKLPTVFQWDKAARNGGSLPFGTYYPWGLVPSGVTDVAHRANFRGSGTMPVTSLPSGMSAHGAYHLAGNVAEWCLNAYGDGVTVTGGDFNAPIYSFGQFGAYPPSYAASNIGFRCVKTVAPKGDQGAAPISFNELKVELRPVGDAEFAKIRASYDYPAAPLDAKVIERRQADAWTRETIEFQGAHERTRAYLYLPKNAKPPYQVIHFVPAGDVEVGIRSLDASTEAFLGPYIRGGRAVFAVILRGYLGRRTGDLSPVDISSEEHIERMYERATDLRRGLDYLVSRPDIDRARLGYYGPSAGGTIGVIVAALEDRYRAVGLMGVGVPPEIVRDMHPKASLINFAPRLRASKLILHGRWDEAHPLQSQALPLYELMPEPKRFVVADGGHVPPMDVSRRVFLEFFDQELGKVQR